MNNSESNLKFEYLYRDAGNYKQFGQIVIKNPNGLDIKKINEDIRKKLIDGEYFYPKQIGVPKIEIYAFDPEMDHEWYEFLNFSISDETPTEDINVENFLEKF